MAIIRYMGEEKKGIQVGISTPEGYKKITLKPGNNKISDEVLKLGMKGSII